MNKFDNIISEVVEEIEKQLGHDVDLTNEMYILQTPSAYVKFGFEENDEGENTLVVNVTGGQLTYLETNNDIFNELYGGNDDDTTN